MPEAEREAPGLDASPPAGSALASDSETPDDADSDTTAETHREKEQQERKSALCAVELEALQALRASVSHYERLQAIAEEVTATVRAMAPAAQVVVYGSLALSVEDRYYLTHTSDVDLAIEGVKGEAVTAKLIAQGWEVASSCKLARFGTTQYTLRHAKGEILDLTFVDSAKHFALFQARQVEFRRYFESGRERLTQHFKERGGQLFESYVHLLKAFASWGGLSSFQAVCTGLFVLHHELHRWDDAGGRPDVKTSALRALPLFERFLHFAATFFAGSCSAMTSQPWQTLRQRTQHLEHPPLELISGMGGCASWVLDLSTTTWRPRTSRYWQAEMYFCRVEEEQGVPAPKRMNVAHSVVPATVQQNAAWIMKKLIQAAPMHWTNWTHEGERQRWTVLLQLLGCERKPAASA